jgi:HEAT repeat protein
VLISVSNGRVTEAHTYVGEPRDRINIVTDLGTVSASEAAAFFFSLVPVLERARDRSRTLLPAVLAEAGDVTPQLLALARDEARTLDTRRQAIMWTGLLGDAKVIPALVGFARSGDIGTEDEPDETDQAMGTKGLAAAAMAALATIADGAGTPPLIELATKGSVGIRRSAVFWLGQTGDPRAFAPLHDIIENQREDEGVRSRAIFSLSHGDDIPAGEFAYLRGIYARLGSKKLKDAVLMGMGEDKSDGSKWLLERARDAGEPLETRKTALFWAGQRDLIPTSQLAAYYRSATEPSLKEHAIFVISQRDDEAALEELMRIAREDSDKRMRARALFWLGQKDDPRVAKFIQERIER